MSLNVPIQMLFESQGHPVVIETITGDVYHGKLLLVEANMNCEMQYVSVKFKNGETVEMENIFIRGSKIVFLILPSIFEKHPVFGTLVPRPMKSPEPKNKSKWKKFGKSKAPQTTPINMAGIPGPSTSKKKKGKNPQTAPMNVKGASQGPSTSRKKGG